LTLHVRHVHASVRPGGGPHGYLHLLEQALGSEPAPADLAVAVSALALAPPAPPTDLGARLRALPGIRGVLHRLHGEFGLRCAAAEREWEGVYAGLGRAQLRDLLACDLLVAHDTFLVRRLAKLAPAATRERVALMTHAPAFVVEQIAGDLDPDADLAELGRRPAVERAREREIATMRAARVVIWPSSGAQDGYPGWNRDTPVDFAPTGVACPEPRTDPLQLRARWEVGARRLALFMGRPHPQKGFDRFVDLAEAARRRGGDWVFVQAGPAPRRTARDLSAVRCVGYETDNGAAYLAADLVLFPNRHAYLDIGLLECLALGAPIGLALVGGHRDLARACPELLEIPEGAAEAAWAGLAESALAMGSEPARAARRAHWERHHSLAPFAAGHRALARRLLGAP
jgi:hypothetical protein